METVIIATTLSMPITLGQSSRYKTSLHCSIKSICNSHRVGIPVVIDVLKEIECVEATDPSLDRDVTVYTCTAHVRAHVGSCLFPCWKIQETFTLINTYVQCCEAFF